MHFTVVFSGDESHDLSFGLVFVPNPCWVRGDEMVLNLNPRTPKLEPGAVRRLLDHLGAREEIVRGGLRCTLIVHAGGHGGPAELALISDELKAESLAVSVVDSSNVTLHPDIGLSAPSDRFRDWSPETVNIAMPVDSPRNGNANA